MKKFLLMAACSIFCLIPNAHAQSNLEAKTATNPGNTLKVEHKKDYISSVNDKTLSAESSTVKLFGDNESNNSTKETLEELREKAENGNLQAQLDLGYMYLYGSNDVAIDYKSALRYYEMAAQQKSAVALNNLGSFYFNGIGTKVNYSKAIGFFEEAAKLGSDDAAVNLAIIYLGSDTKHKNISDLEKVLPLLEQAQSNNSIAKYLLGYSYLNGFLVDENKEKAFELIKSAADEGYDEAQLILADFYINGWSTPKNYNRAVQYLRSAADQGNAEAMYRLGTILSEGKIYTQDQLTAHIYYNLAAVFGVKEAAVKRDELENKIDIADLLKIQADAESFKAEPTKQTAFIRQTYGKSLKIYIDLNLKLSKK